MVMLLINRLGLVLNYRDVDVIHYGQVVLARRIRVQVLAAVPLAVRPLVDFAQRSLLPHFGRLGSLALLMMLRAQNQPVKIC